MSPKKCRIYLILGEANVCTFFDSMCSDRKRLMDLMKSIEIMEFDTEEEGEAFRMGLCLVSTKNTKDFTEITEAVLRKLKKRVGVS